MTLEDPEDLKIEKVKPLTLESNSNFSQLTIDSTSYNSGNSVKIDMVEEPKSRQTLATTGLSDRPVAPSAPALPLALPIVNHEPIIETSIETPERPTFNNLHPQNLGSNASSTPGNQIEHFQSKSCKLPFSSKFKEQNLKIDDISNALQDKSVNLNPQVTIMQERHTIASVTEGHKKKLGKLWDSTKSKGPEYKKKVVKLKKVLSIVDKN